MKEKGEKKFKLRHKPLGDEIESLGAVRQKHREKSKRTAEKESQGKDDEFVEAGLSHNILKIARDQLDEDIMEHRAGKKKASASAAAFSRSKQSADSDGEGEEEEMSEDEAYNEEEQDTLYESLAIDAADEEAIKLFMPAEVPSRLTLADVVMGKIKDKETEIMSQMSEAAPAELPPLDPKIIRVYQSVGQILASYRSGKLPKAFKIIPSLKNWEEVLYLTNPDSWTAASIYQATRLFASNLNAKMAQRFYNLVLLPRVRDDIAEYKRLNFHLFMALKKSIFKPAAFFKGILIPLCEAGDCTLKEAVIISSVLTRTSIPVLHSAAAMLKIAEMEYTGANSIFLRVLLDKKYALPYRVVDALVHHFYRFVSDQREMPVLWHQALLVFVQRYKEDITSEQKDALLELLRAHTREGLTEEVRREIVHSRSRDSDVAMEPEPFGSGGAPMSM